MPCHKPLAQAERCAFDQLVCIVDEVVAAFELHELIRLELHIVFVEIIPDRAVFDDHFTIGVKLIFARRHRCAVGIGMPCHETVRKRERHVFRQFVGVADEIMRTLIFYQLIRLHDRVVFVEIRADGAVFDDHSAVFVKRVFARLHRRAVGIGIACHKTVR